MTPTIKKIAICIFIGIFLVSALLCCCLTKPVEAKEPQPSCHQTNPQPESSQTHEECDCDQFLTTVQKTAFSKASIQHITILTIDQLSSDRIDLALGIDAPHAPPFAYDTSPLYIKHSILRI